MHDLKLRLRHTLYDERPKRQIRTYDYNSGEFRYEELK
jgi:hypothetical protein